MQKTLLLLGSSGLVGTQVLTQALGDPRVASVVAPTRKSLSRHPFIQNPILDYGELDPKAPWWKADACICTLGTTIKREGSRESFERVDRDYVVHAAKLAHQAGTPCFAYNSSLGADPHSRNFYLRIKGLVEQDLRGQGFDSLVLVRPSLLDGGSRREFRLGERVALALMRPFASVLPRRYRPVSPVVVGRALLEAALKASPGCAIIESDQLQSMRS